MKTVARLYNLFHVLMVVVFPCCVQFCMYHILCLEHQRLIHAVVYSRLCTHVFMYILFCVWRSLVNIDFFFFFFFFFFHCSIDGCRVCTTPSLPVSLTKQFPWWSVKMAQACLSLSFSLSLSVHVSGEADSCISQHFSVLQWQIKTLKRLDKTLFFFFFLVIIRQGRCLMDIIKEWTSLPMPELLTRASCRKRLEEDLCWIIPHIPRTTQSVKGPEPVLWTAHIVHLTIFERCTFMPLRGLTFGVYMPFWGCTTPIQQAQLAPPQPVA